MARIPGGDGVSSTVVDHADLPPLRLSGRPRRLVPMVVAYEPIPEAVSLEGGSTFRFLMEPVTAVAVVFDEGWVIVDGGFEPARIRDRATRTASFDYENYTPIVPPGDPLVDQLAEAGLDLADLAAALLTHSHFDHTGAARLLTPDQPLLLQRREWQHVRETTDARGNFLFRADLDRDGLTLGLLDGDTPLVAGLTAIDTSGHTPGHQSFVVELPARTVVLAGDAADLLDNIEREVRCGSTVGVDGPELADRAISRLASLRRAPSSEVWPAHDPGFPVWTGVIASR
ncbi:MBL fold metallo-hydrolase [Microbacterium testaceum]|uniref:MBL fold metallo-hydrolase n=1 Tax=Microbacterium testaceum TaxID=2033 RepID=UPI003412F13A